METYDRIIIGAGIYGLYAASVSAQKGYKVAVIEADGEVLRRGSFINQARLHSGYHYPRSKETAEKSRDYFFRFINDFPNAINSDFKQIYAIAHEGSKTSAKGFEDFCQDLHIKCDKLDSKKYFKDGMVDGVYDTLEYAIDRDILASELLKKCDYPNLDIFYNHKVIGITQYKNDNSETGYEFVIDTGTKQFKTTWLLNATYANVNQIISLVNSDRDEEHKIPMVPIKYELCEILLCSVTENLKDIGITVMDGPFFSVMPFGKTGLHSLTSVTFTPHKTCWDILPNFECQNCNLKCKSMFDNCNTCIHRPDSAWDRMYGLAKEYFNDDIDMKFVASYITIKPILTAREDDDGRPTLVIDYKNCPGFYTVFSGKLNTIYDLDKIL